MPLNGDDPAANLSRVLDDITEWHQDAAFCVISGDLADEDDIQAYAWLKDQLTHFPLPTFLMLSDHDVRQSFLQVFADHPRDASGYVQHSHVLDGTTFLSCCSTH